MAARRQLLLKVIDRLFQQGRSAAAKRRTRRVFLEQLEYRELLTGIPVAINDPLYATPLNTALTISTTNAGVVNNDFDPESASLSASVVANPANGTLSSFNSNGTFTYVPNSGFTGFDTFTYKVNDGSLDSNVATVTIAVGGNFGPRTNRDTRIQGNMLDTGALTVSQPLTMGRSLIYRSDTDSTWPVVIVETSLVAGSSIPDSIDAVLDFGGVVGSAVSYNTSGLSAGDPLRFVLQVDASSLDTGMHDWAVELTANFTGSGSVSRTFTGKQALVDRTASPFGAGWWLDGLDQLYVDGDGALLVRGNGSTLWFASDGAGGYESAEGDLSYASLVQNVGGDYTLTTKYGDKQNFDSSGKLTSLVNANDVTSTFTYSGGLLSKISDHFGRDFTFSYTSGLLTGVTDFAGRTVDLSHSGGRLTSVSQEDPDGGGSQSAPVWEYTYDATTGLLINQEDPLDHDTSYAYNATSRRLSIITHHDATTWSLVPSQTQGLKTGSGNSLFAPQDVDARTTDERGYLSRFKTDWLGNIVEWKDPLNAVTTTEYGPNGQVLRRTDADPDDSGSLTSPVTVFGYNADGDLVKQINPDATALSWTYNSLHRILTATDEMNRVTTMTYDADGNLLTKQDNAGNTWTYTVNSRGQVLTETTPDPDGAGPLSASVTTYAYDSYGRLDTITWPDNELVDYAHNSADMVTSATDELGNVTGFTFDALDRMTVKTLPDPDGAGPLTAPAWTYTYNALGLLTEEVDPLGNDTDYEYNVRNWLTKKTLPDPDGAGSLVRPESTYTYDNAGNRTRTGEYYMYGGAHTDYAYDANGRLTSITGPQAGKSESFYYDKLGRLTQHVDPYQRDSRFEYDVRGRLTASLDHPQGMYGGRPTTAYTYNSAGQLHSVADPLGNVTSYDYTPAGWLNSTTLPDPDGSGPNFSPSYTYGYDALGRRVSVTDPLNRITMTAYDSRGRVTSITGADPDGAGSQAAPVTGYGHDAAGRLVSVTDPLGRVTSHTFDDLGRLLTVTLPDPDGAGGSSSPVQSYAYNALGSVVSYTDPAGKSTTTAYDNLQRKISETLPDPDGAGALSAPVWTYTYGANSLLGSVTDPLSRVTTYGYDDYGRKTSVTTDLGNTSTYAYDYLDRVISLTEPDPDGAGALTAPVTTFQYDIYGNLILTSNPKDGDTSFTFDSAGRMLSLTDPLGNATTWSYDALGRVTMETNELGKSRSFSYDALGNVTRRVDREGRVTQYEYDSLDRMTAEKWIGNGIPVPSLAVNTTTPGGAASELQRIGITAPSGFYGGSFTLQYNGQTTSPIAYNASASTVQSALEALSNVGAGDVSVAKTQNTFNAQEWSLSFGGTLAAADLPQTTIDSSGVTSMGSKTEIEATDRNGQPSTTDEVQTITLSNATGGTFRLAFGGQTTAPLDYDATAAEVESALESLQSVDDVSVTGNAGGPWTVAFAGAHADMDVATIQGDVATVMSGSVARTLSFEYDLAGQLTEASDPAATYNYALDNLGRVTSETQDLANLTPNVVLASTWDANGNRLSQAATLGSNADFKNEYTYDYLNRMTRVTQQGQSGGSAVAAKRVDFAYNGSGQFTTIDRYQNIGGTNIVAQTTFAYDDDNRLTDLDHKQSTTTLAAYDYAYDQLGRITSIISSVEGTSAFTYDETNQLTGADHASPRTDETYTYDANGNRTGGGYSTNSNNLTVSDGTYDYEYDDEGNRTKRTNISTGDYEVYEWDHRNRLVSVTTKDASEVVTEVVNFTYDYLDRLIGRSADPDGDGAAAAVDTFFAYDGIQPILQFGGSAASDLDHRYLFGPAVDQVLADEGVSSLGTAGNTLWALGDHQGTVRDIADQDESTFSTAVTNHRTYDAFGVLTSESNNAVDLIFGYTGKLFDELTGLQNNWKRWYDSALGQWISEDPSGFGGADVSLRRYVGNASPLTVDPTGLQPPIYQPTPIDDIFGNPPWGPPVIPFPGGGGIGGGYGPGGPWGGGTLPFPGGGGIGGGYGPGGPWGGGNLPFPGGGGIGGGYGPGGPWGGGTLPFPGGGGIGGGYGPGGPWGGGNLPFPGGGGIGGGYGPGGPWGGGTLPFPGGGGIGGGYGPGGPWGGGTLPFPGGGGIGGGYGPGGPWGGGTLPFPGGGGIGGGYGPGGPWGGGTLPFPGGGGIGGGYGPGGPWGGGTLPFPGGGGIGGGYGPGGPWGGGTLPFPGGGGIGGGYGPGGPWGGGTLPFPGGGGIGGGYGPGGPWGGGTLPFPGGGGIGGGYGPGGPWGGGTLPFPGGGGIGGGYGPGGPWGGGYFPFPPSWPGNGGIWGGYNPDGSYGGGIIIEW